MDRLLFFPILSFAVLLGIANAQPSLSNITPNYAIFNQQQTFSVYVSSNVSLSNITWAFTQYNASGFQIGNTTYYTDIATANAINYQQFTFNSAYGKVQALACDINANCTSVQETIPIEIATPPSYWSFVPTYSSLLFSQSPENLTLALYPNNDTYPLGSIGISWGDGDVSRGTFPNGGVFGNPYVATYLHYYQQAGNYTISIKACDTQYNCNTETLNVTVAQPLQYITDLTSFGQAIAGFSNDIQNSTFLTEFSVETGLDNNYLSFSVLLLIGVLSVWSALWVIFRAIEKPIGA